MLKLTIVLSENFDESTNQFLTETMDIELEHSLASLSKWEMIWEVPLLSTKDKTQEQNFSYLECMCLTPNVPPEVLRKLSKANQNQLAEYLTKRNSATWFSNVPPESKSGETITAELIYYWMDTAKINWEAQYWPINRLLDLIKIHSMKADNNPRKQSQRSRQDEINRVNAQRRKETGSKG